MSTVKHRIRHLRLKLVPERGWFHPIETDIIPASDVHRQAIHEMKLLDEETVMTLYEFSGEPATIRDICERREEIHTYELFESGDRLFVYAQFEPNEFVSGFIELQRELRVVVGHVTEFTDDGSIRTTLIGRMDHLRETAAALDDWVDVTIEQVGEYHPPDAQLYHALTGRQRETLRVALELGYYESPRQATHADIADALDRTSGTVAEHLQKVESAVLHEVVPE